MRKTAFVLFVLLAAVALAEQGADYLIICADNLRASVLPLAEWKQATGLKVMVVNESQVGYDTTAIRNYVRSAWSTWNPRPEYLLLVGASSMLPARLYYSHGEVYASSDNIYADMNGDMLADLAVGRLPAATTAQLDVMVAKTLCYEHDPDLSDSLWMRRMTTIVREGQDPDDTIYWDNIRRVAAQATAAGFVSVDSLSSLRGDDWQKVVASANAGTGIILYRGTANGSWYQPFDIRPSQITASNKLPIVTSMTCATMTLVPGEEMLGDSWMRTGTLTNLCGAVAFFGNTHAASNVAQLRGAVCRGFFDGLFTENTWRLGKAVIRAKQQLFSEYRYSPESTSCIRDYRGFGLLGDPDLAIWTAVPRRLAVTHPASIDLGPQQVPVSVSYDSLPVCGATVCASMTADTTVFAVDSTDSTGTVHLSVDAHVSGRLRIVVTGQNSYPYDKEIPVGPTAACEPVVPARPARLELSSAPAPFRRATRINWNVPLLGPATLAVTDATGRVLAEIPCPTSSVTARWSGRDGRGQPAAPGVYFAVLRDHEGRDRAQAKMVKLQ